MLVQPFGLGGSGGGARILRSLVAGRRGEFVSVATGTDPPPATTLGEEAHLPARPRLGRVDSTRLGRWADWAARAAARRGFRRRLGELVARRRPSAVHAIAHESDFYDAFLVSRAAGVPYTLTVHDDPAYGHRGHPGRRGFERALARAWREANRRIVICQDMGVDYQRRFGGRPFDVVTDSVDLPPLACRRAAPSGRRVYFMGSLHLSYRRNFEALSAGAAELSAREPDLDVTLVSRGSQPPVAAGGETFDVRCWGTEADVADDLASADLLYLPIPFEPEFEAFARLSLPTKLVTYLGSGLPILYHGPAYSSSSRLLAEFDAAIQVHSTRPEDVAAALSSATAARREAVAEAALRLARKRFDAASLRRLFWDHVPTTCSAGRREEMADVPAA